MRQPFQVLVIPFKVVNGSILYCILKREDLSCWQWIAGGGEEGETSLEAAIREANEELNISKESKYIKLDTRSSIRGDNFKPYNEKLWPSSVYVVPEYSFAVEVNDQNKLDISDEHKEYKWCGYTECLDMLEWDSNKTALWELNEKLTRDNTR